MNIMRGLTTTTTMMTSASQDEVAHEQHGELSLLPQLS